MAFRLQSNQQEVTPVSGLMKVCGAIVFGLVLGAGVDASAATVTTSKAKRHSAGTTRVASKLTTKSASAKRSSGTAHAVATTKVGVRRRGRVARPMLAVRRTRFYERFTASSFADNLTLGDVVEGEDPVVRA